MIHNFIIKQVNERRDWYICQYTNGGVIYTGFGNTPSEAFNACYKDIPDAKCFEYGLCDAPLGE